jgi:hypothetical protein
VFEQEIGDSVFFLASFERAQVDMRWHRLVHSRVFFCRPINAVIKQPLVLREVSSEHLILFWKVRNIICKHEVLAYTQLC